MSQTDDLHAHDWPEVALDGSTAPRCVICGVEWQPEEDSLLVVDGVTGKTYVGTKADVDRENARYKSPDQPAQRAQWLAQQAPMDYLIATHGRCEVCSAPRTVIDHSTHAGQMQKTLVCSTDLGHVDRRDQPRTDGRRSAQMTDEETEAALAALPPRSDGRRAEWDLLSPDGKVQSRLAGTEFVPLTLEQRVTTLEANVRALNARPIYYGQGDPNR